MASSIETATPVPDSADLLPARMLNEFVYCPRLFYYEHVEGVFLHSADTKKGAAEHTRVDAGKGDLPPAARSGDNPVAESESGGLSASGLETDLKSEIGSTPPPPEAASMETIHARSVMLGSATLGVVAKLDLVEVTLEPSLDLGGGPGLAGAVCPVEYKTGAPREGENGRELWPADRMQLGLQILLLRENGYRCDEGVIFYRQTRQRVRWVPTAADEAWILRGIAAARDCAKGPIPPPLDHSPKCPRCSLAPICMPDETQFLQGALPEPEPPPRFLVQLNLDGFVAETSPPADPAALAAELSIEDPAWTRLPEARLPRPAGSGEVRRLMAPDVDTKVLYVNTPGSFVSRKGETVVVKDQGGPLADVRIKDLHHLAVFGSSQISTALIQTLCEKEVPISYFSMGGWFYGLTRGHGLTNVFTRIRQFATAADPEKALTLARLFVYGKIRNQRTLFMRNHVEPPPVALRALRNAASAALVAPNLPSLLGVEGAAALVYFQNFNGMIKGRADDDADDELPGLEDSVSTRVRDAQKEFPFDFKTRNRRPPRDPVNALLSLAYSLLARDCTVAALAVGFDPYVGLCHQPRFGRPALALDVMEEFRPLIADSVVLTAINNRMVTPLDFVRAGDAVNLTPDGRKRFFLAYEKRLGDTVTHPLFDYKVSYRRAIELQFRLLARTLTGEIECYLPFMTR
jgi:CRISPR-associated protein Cas1